MSFFNYIRKPAAINIISLSITILSVVLTIIFYFNSIEKKKPTYLVSKNEQKLYDKSLFSSDIKLIYNKTEVIKDDIYALEICFWNAGNLAIEPKDVKKPVRIILSPCKKILDYRIVDVTPRDLAKFEIHADTTNASNNPSKGLIINWQLFEPNFGLKFQVIYISDKTPKVELDGFISGVSGFTDAQPLWKKSGIAISIFILLLILLISFLIDVLPRLYRKYVGFQKYIRLSLYLLCIFMSFLFYYIIAIKGLKPPL